MIGHLALGHSMQKKTHRQSLYRAERVKRWGFHQDLRK